MSLIRDHARYYEAPPGLEQEIRASLQRESAPRNTWRLFAIAATLFLIASLALNVALLRSRSDHEQLLAASVLSAHLRSLASEHLFDVPSSDRHTVKPWFNGRLDFSPTVKDIEGFPLLGGRIEYFEGRSAAALVYGRQKHIVNLFTWPSTAPAAPSAQTRNGYHLQTWTSGEMTYWAVSDLNETELRQFVSLYRQN